MTRDLFCLFREVEIRRISFFFPSPLLARSCFYLSPTDQNRKKVEEEENLFSFLLRCVFPFSPCCLAGEQVAEVCARAEIG